MPLNETVPAMIFTRIVITVGKPVDPGGINTYYIRRDSALGCSMHQGTIEDVLRLVYDELSVDEQAFVDCILD